jgi:uncharacterized protein YjdB
MIYFHHAISEGGSCGFWSSYKHSKSDTVRFKIPIWFFLLIFLLGTGANVFATDYYVSSSSGNDNYNGLSQTYNGTNGPWSSLTKVSSITFNSGDRIFLKTGDTWISQTLALKGLGTSSNPITLSTYGAAAKPIISPRITDSYGVTIKNTGGWKILGLEIEKARAGIALQFDNSYNNDYVFIDNCNIHDIDDTYNSNPNLYNHISSGILMEGNGNSSPYHLTNLTVQNIVFNNVNCAWWVGCIAAYTNSSGFGSNSSFRYVTVNNLSATNCKQWGYSLLFMEDATITNADADNTGFGTNPYGAAGALVAYSRRVTLDGCDMYNSHRGPQLYDGCGFDFEGGVNTSDVTYKNATIDHTDGCGIFIFNNGGNGGTTNILIDNVTISNFGENPGNTSAGIDFSTPGNSSGTVKNCIFNRSITANDFYTGYPSTPANFTFTGNTFNDNNGGGTNIAPNATVTASTTDVGNGYSTAKAVDGITADWGGWASTVGAPQWLQLTWSSSQSINKVDLYTTTNYFLKDYDVQYWDGSTWVNAASVRNNTQKLTTSTFTTVNTTQLRIYCITADQTSYCRIDELKVYSTSGTVGVTGVSISPSSASVNVSGTQQLNASITPSNASNTNVTWSSSNTSVATVNSSGLVTGVAVGTATITVTTQDGSKTANCTITVVSNGGTNIAPNATVTASTTDVGNGYSTAKAVDGITTDWEGWASTVGVPQWLQLTWSSSQSINKVDLYTTTNYFLKDYDVQYWDGSTWVNAASVRNNTQKLTTSTFTTVNTTQLRIYCITADQTSYCRIDELKVYSTSGTECNWIFAANENETATFSGTKQVRYGANGTYVTLTATNSIGCNNSVFGDPTPGVVKKCQVCESSAANCNWTFAANENGTATFSGTKQVRYGANGTYFTLTATNSIGCNNSVFGDPTPGVVKTCEVCNSATGSRAALIREPAVAVDSIHSIKIYPNPSNGFAHLEYQFPAKSKASLSIYNIVRKLVKQLNFITANAAFGKIDIDLSGLSNGTYVIRLNVNNLSVPYKLIIIK